MSDKEHKDLVRSINGYVWVSNQDTKNRRRQTIKRGKYQANRLITRNKERAIKGLPPLSQ